MYIILVCKWQCLHPQVYIIIWIYRTWINYNYNYNYTLIMTLECTDEGKEKFANWIQTTCNICTASQMKHQLDAPLCRFYFCRVTLHVSGAKRPSSGVFKTSTVATGTCVIIAGKLSYLLIRVFGPNKEMWWLTCNDNTCTSGRCITFKYSWWWALASETCRVTLQK